MSIEIMQRIWKSSKAKGSRRLALLAIADNCNDAGWAYPGLENLCKKTMVSRPTMQRYIDDLVILNELYVHAKPGRGHNYGVLVDMNENQQKGLIEWIEKKRGGPSEYRVNKTYLRVKTSLPERTIRLAGRGQDVFTRSVSNPEDNHQGAFRLLERHFAQSPTGALLEQWVHQCERAGEEIFEQALILTVNAGGGRKMNIKYVTAVIDRLLTEKNGSLTFNERMTLQELGVKL